MPLRLARPILALTLAAFTLPALAQDKPSGEDAGAYLAARVAATENDYAEAAAWYDRLLQSAPNDPALLEGAVISNMGLGDVAKAAGFADRLAKAGGTSQVAWTATIAEKAQKGDFKGIIDDQKAGRTAGKLLDGLVTAWAALGNGDMTDALAGFDALSKTQGLEAFGLYHKALALASAGDFEGADDILSGKDSGPIAVMRRGVIAHVQILSQLERNPDAIALLDRNFGTEADPQIDALRTRLKAGEVLPFDIVTNAKDGIAEVFFTLAAALRGEADDGFTLLYTRITAYLQPGHGEALLLSAALLESLGQPALAEETYALIPADSPSYHIAEIGRADTLFAQDKSDAAIEVLQSLARTHGNLVAVQTALGDALRREERFKEAIPAYDAAIGLIGKPERRHWGLFYARGISHERSGDFKTFESDLRRALELEPDQPQVLNYLGYSFVDRGENLDEAMKMIQTAVAKQPDAGYIIDSLAWAYFRLGKYEEAVEPMEKASLLEPVDPIVTDHLGDVYWAVGRQREAQFQWRRALSFDPEEKDATRIRAKLEKGLDAVLAAEGAKPLTDVADGN
ncbi:tetratricopeptide repeat protein [Paragemmobacter straminiformis]|uniref:Tetratricopeptide repeat protein n=1 Tax=Paragemmobacter straminiformis TaxID=2045119 RepID=A0A842I4Z5_9RHOB|nr:tetratricopeptide repeat protein [Gemmobacter straminiformis]MBC2834726.1 tetratricopeptide repeat protein [Gemmobacter straminiformis]